MASKIVVQKKRNTYTYILRLKDSYSQERNLTIHILDLQKGIAVFEETIPGRGTRYSFMIRAEKIKRVPILVNHCPTQKQMELKFDDPDFKSILQKNKKPTK